METVNQITDVEKIPNDNIPIPAKSMRLDAIDSSYNKKSFIVQLANGKQFEVNNLIASLISKIDGIRNIASITSEFNNENVKNYSEEDIKKIIDTILRPKNIVVDGTEEATEIPVQKKKSYMWFRLDFLHEENVNVAANILKFIFSPFVLAGIIALSVVVHFAYYMFIMEPTYVDPDLIFSSKFIIMFLLLNLDNLFHELGHASALRYYGQKPNNIGIGIYMFMIVLYADVTNVWKLKRKQRILVNLGGFIFELIILNLIIGLYLLTNDVIFLLTFLLIDLKIVFGLNPFFRFDGYWIFNDLLGLTNLREKSNQLLKYLANKIALRSNTIPTFWKNLNKSTRILLVIYSLLSLVFFSWVAYQLVVVSYSFLLNIDTQIYSFGTMMFKDFNFGRLFVTGTFLLGKLLMILFTFITILKIMRYTILLYKR